MLRPLWLCFLLTLSSLLLNGCKPSNPPHASPPPTHPAAQEFLQTMTAGRNALEQSDATQAITAFQKATQLLPSDPDAHLNLAIAHLLADQPQQAIASSQTVLQSDPESAAAYFIQGSAALRLGHYLDAVKALENVRKMEPGETASCFQLGMARMGLKQWDEAAKAFREGIALAPNRFHSAAHYQLAQSLVRAGKPAEAQEALKGHEIDLAGGGPTITAATFERSKFTQARVPFTLAQPQPQTPRVRFEDATTDVLGPHASRWSGPIAIIDLQHRSSPSLFVMEDSSRFRLLQNVGGQLTPTEPSYPATPGNHYHRILVGDLQNDRWDDLIILGDQGSHVLQMNSNHVAAEITLPNSVSPQKAGDGLLLDLDFTGKLDLVTLSSTDHSLRIHRQYGPLRFHSITETSNLPRLDGNLTSLRMEDWNRDKHMDLIASRSNLPPVVFEKLRGGGWRLRELTNVTSGLAMTTGDFDNDLRPDLIVCDPQTIHVYGNGGEHRQWPVSGSLEGTSRVAAMDYDNDGWLDLWVVGKTLRVWRNLGLAGFQEQTQNLGLSSLTGGPFEFISFADFDGDCDTDVAVAGRSGGLRILRNNGGNALQQIKVNLFGNRSNASGIGCKIEVQTGALRLIRTVDSLPVEIGVGPHQKLDSFLVHWFNWPQGSAGLGFTCKDPIYAQELSIQEGSCPYVYVWDGTRFRFVTDILGAAPLGLPLAPGRHIEADPEELVWLGTENTCRPLQGNLKIQITEELREVLYLDHARLVVVDQEQGTEIHPTCKLLPGKPFPQPRLITLHQEQPIAQAITLDGVDVTRQLKSVDNIRVSPPQLRTPQLRGLAESHGVILNFGAINTRKPLVLVLNGWLRFGGGMANIAASHDPDLPFPFPTLEAETAPHHWTRIDVTPGAPAGKTKTILVDLEGKLPPGTQRLKLSQAFEIHWDRIALLQKKADSPPPQHILAASVADLHFRGFSRLLTLPPDHPLTPDYHNVSQRSPWTIIPEGWATRYGDVRELIEHRDEGLALIHSGDELTLEFPISQLPPAPAGSERHYFLHVDGWDKDSDFHVTTGDQVEPLPFHGMDDQAYGTQPRPRFPSDPLHERYNTRWVSGKALSPTLTFGDGPR